MRFSYIKILVFLFFASQANAQESKAFGIQINLNQVTGYDSIDDISIMPKIELFNVKTFDLDALKNNIFLTKTHLGNYLQSIALEISLDKKEGLVFLKPSFELQELATYKLYVSGKLTKNGFPFEIKLCTQAGDGNKFPIISDEALLTKIQKQTFKYFWDYGHPVSGMARERNNNYNRDGEIVTSGGTGFGLMAIIVAIERGFITREEGIERIQKIVDFLDKKVPKFHGAWPHWMNGTTGEVISFWGKEDNGADLSESSYMAVGLLTVRQYLNQNDKKEKELYTKINRMWEAVEWNFFTKSGKENVIYWHWSPQYEYKINLPISGYHESMITYILAASCPFYSIDPIVYHEGWARQGAHKSGEEYYGYTLPLSHTKGSYGGPLFMSQYSFLGINPKGLKDKYADYWEQGKTHALINRAYCIDNPKNYTGYGQNFWGLTSSDSHINGGKGYGNHAPNADTGVITPTAAISSIIYTPDYSMDAIRFFYYKLGNRLWGEYGFFDAINPTENWVADGYLAIDQGPIIIMIENYRTGLLWDLFMSNPEINDGLKRLGFYYD
ncbi:glucoamylase family protein [Seonamhaeicola sp.]|uniref:glucoamylase family protein n=1 Tax=Seonamhaeicola sp. TaxID=1912245 RepID=UPI00261AF4AF|nr:glucoamylase family protein [Seonamhaeicola sp.]